MKKSKNKQLLVLVTLLTFGVLAFIGMSIIPNKLKASTYIQNPEQAEEAKLAVPLLISPDFDSYSTLSAIDSVQSLADTASVPFAYTTKLPDNFGEAEVSYMFPSAEDWWQSEGVIGFPNLSNVRYTSANHVLVISVSKFNPGALKQEFIAGEETITFTDGSQGWLTSGRLDQFTNAIVVFRNELIVTLASDLPQGDLTEIAESLVIEGSEK